MPESSDLDLLIEGARAAGDIARKFFKANPETWEKSGDAGPVTEADIAIDTMLRHELRAARPDYGWLSEETEDDKSRLSAQDVFIVDPIDGTRAFVAGEASFSHSLAIARNGIVTAAVVYLPVKEKLYYASKNGPSLCNDVTLSCSEADIGSARVLATKPNMKPEFWNGTVPSFSRHFRPSLAYRLSLVAEGMFDAMLSFRPCWEWDIAAGALIVARAGGIASDQNGGELRFNSANAQTSGCVAAGPALHASLMDHMA
ncbi:MAG: 3'(2'),5'-bisphosphate nucleotidase CysQ [Pseudomonadota bacterium]